MNIDPLQAYLNLEKEKTEAWIAEDPKNRWATVFSIDLGHWNDRGIFTVAQFERYLDEECYVNIYKDTHGIRPSRGSVGTMSDKELEKAIQNLTEKTADFTKKPKKKPKKKPNRKCSFDIMANALKKHLGESNGQKEKGQSS